MDLRRFKRRERAVAERLLRQPARGMEDAGACIVGGTDRGETEQGEMDRAFVDLAPPVALEEIVGHHATPLKNNCDPTFIGVSPFAHGGTFPIGVIARGA